MALLQEALTMEEFEKWDKGLPIHKKKSKPRPEPEPPVIENEIKCEDIETFIALESASRSCLLNKSGTMFLGYDVVIRGILTSPPGYPKMKKPQEEETKKEEQTIKGWMKEGEFLKLIKMYQREIDTKIIVW